MLKKRERLKRKQGSMAMTIAKLLAGRSASAIIHCDASATVRDVVALLAEKRIGALPVMQDGAVAGIFSERDVIRQLSAKGAAMLDGPVGEVMTAPAVTVTPDTPIISALALMTRRRIRHLPVIESEAMIGF